MRTVNWQAKAVKQLKKLGDKAIQTRILDATAKLAGFPDVSGVKALTHHIHGYRLRVGNYRVIFNDHPAIEIISIEEVKKRDEHTY